MVSFAEQRQNANQPLTPSEGLAFVNSLLEKNDSVVKKKLKELQKKHHGSSIGHATTGYGKGFMKRHKELLDSSTGERFAMNREEWCTYENLDKMYTLLYARMVKAKIACWLPEEEWYYINSNGDKCSEDNPDRFGHQVKIELLHPEYLVFGDELGCNICQKDDKKKGSQRYVGRKGSRKKIKSGTKNQRLTVMGIMSGTGDPIMCVLIFAAQELTLEQRFGIDMKALRAVNLESGGIMDNLGPGKAFPGGPTCNF